MVKEIYRYSVYLYHTNYLHMEDLAPTTFPTLVGLWYKTDK